MSKVLITRSKLDGLATTIAAKSGATLPLTIAQMDAAVDGIVVGSGTDTSHDTVDAAHLLEGYTAHDSTGSAITGTYVPPTFTTQSKTATPTESQQTVSPDSGYDGLSSVTVGAIPNEYIVPSGTKSITANGTGIDVASYASVDVAVPSAGSWQLIASQTLTGVTQTSTSAQAAGTIALGSAAATKDAIIWVHIRDTAGPRAGYFFGSDAIFVNALKANGSTSSFTSPGVETIRYSTSSQYAGYTGAYGVYGYSIANSGTLTVRKRYNSNYSLTINGDYKVDVYKLTPPSGMELFPS